MWGLTKKKPDMTSSIRKKSKPKGKEKKRDQSRRTRSRSPEDVSSSPPPGPTPRRMRAPTMFVSKKKQVVFVAPGTLLETLNVYTSETRYKATEEVRAHAKNAYLAPLFHDVFLPYDKATTVLPDTRTAETLCFMNHHYHPTCCKVGDSVTEQVHEDFVHTAFDLLKEWGGTKPFRRLKRARIRHTTSELYANSKTWQALIKKVALLDVSIYPFSVELLLHVHHHNPRKSLVEEVPNDQLAMHITCVYTKPESEEGATPAVSVDLFIETYGDTYHDTLLGSQPSAQAFIQELGQEAESKGRTVFCKLQNVDKLPFAEEDGLVKETSFYLQKEPTGDFKTHPWFPQTDVLVEKGKGKGESKGEEDEFEFEEANSEEEEGEDEDEEDDEEEEFITKQPASKSVTVSKGGK